MTPPSKSSPLAALLRGCLRPVWVCTLVGTGAAPAALAQSAAELDWVPIERLTDEQRATLDQQCCGLYIAPTFEEAATLEPGGTLLRGTGIGAGDDGVVNVYDNLQVLQGDIAIQAGRGRYDRNSETFSLAEDIRLRQPGMLMVGQQATINQKLGRSEITDASYVLHEAGVRGQAAIIVYTDADGVVTIDNGVYTRCEPGDNSWVIQGERITLDQEKGRGTARNVKLRVADVPVFYLPWVSFPINDERATGFLTPVLGNTRDGGIDIAAPYYLNLAPNYDATITPRIQFERGVMLGVEGRHRGLRSRQELNFTYLPDDRLYDPARRNTPGSDSPPVPDRWSLDYDYLASIAPRWTASVNYAAISDEDYFQDFGRSGLDLNAQSYLYRDARLNYRGVHWDFQAATQGYQIIDPNVTGSTEPYRMLPRLNLDGQYFLHDNLEVGLDSEYVVFDRHLSARRLNQQQIDNGVLVTGQRLSLTPYLSLPWSNAWSFVTPTVKYKYAQWNLSDQKVGASASPDRGIFTGSLDAGLFFERDVDLFGADYSQTLEPRLYYLYSEYEDQSDIPLFDSSELTFSFYQLFRDDRFSGQDRVGDANQLTLAVSSRLYDGAGREKARASIGQIQYFEDRRVALARPDSLDRQASSALVGELSVQLDPRWQARSYVEYNHIDHKLIAGNFLFQYQSDINRILNFGYRFRDLPNPITPTGLDRRIKQTDVSGIWPLNDRWGLIGRWNFDIGNKRNLETIAGVEYSNCCWNLRLVARQWIDNDALFYGVKDDNRGIFIQFELKGLGSVLGGNVSGILNNGITGYRDREYVR
ncbi:MAG TPA: LPS assembly protein LptD [Hyphomicrobiales bacterium]|nr:LPS assembly protein LptD [Hyphomicrobiales bacterium]